MGTTTAADLDEKLSQKIGDWIEEALTTAATVSANVLSTNLNQWDDGGDGHFVGWWVYFTDGANAGVERKVYASITAGGSCTVRGGNLAAETSLATCRFYRYPHTAKRRAINDAIREIGHDVLFQPLDNHELVSGNILPNAHFGAWASTARPDKMTLYGATCVASSTGHSCGAGSTSVTVTATVANDDFLYWAQPSATLAYSNPRLMDLAGKTVNFYCWVWPEQDNDAWIQIYTIDAAGNAQNLPANIAAATVTQTSYAAVPNLLKLENQRLQDDLVEIHFRLRVGTFEYTNVYDHAVATGVPVYEYWLPDEANVGEIKQVWIQTSGDCFGGITGRRHAETWDRIWNWSIRDHDDRRYLRLPHLYTPNKWIRLIGTTPLSEVAADTATVEVSGREADLLVTYAAYCLFRNEEDVPASEDTSRYRSRAMQWYREYERLKPSLRMLEPTGTLIVAEP